ncbi:MAG: NYN domain-containing protein [Candidatus Omnitrophica bacterium]|nr:NYN domain-containing protein [Candidatus Omnitrophota bacterium]
MSLHFLLDGYNIIHKMPFAESDSLEDQRNRLMRLLEVQRPQGSVKNRVTVVFDGQAGFFSPGTSFSSEMIFSSQNSADDKIKEIVEDSSNKKNIVVVTDDRDIRVYVRSLGARVMTVAEFLPKTQTVRQASKAKEAHVEHSKHIPSVLEHKINAEFREIWLTKKST